MRKLFSFIVVAMLATSYSSATEINVETAGTLSSLIGETDKYITESLTLTGQLNGDDIAFIRDMAGSDRDMNTTEGQLKVLDMSGAHIVSGGGYYFYSKATGATYYTTDNQLGDYMFYDCLPLEWGKRRKLLQRKRRSCYSLTWQN